MINVVLAHVRLFSGYLLPKPSRFSFVLTIKIFKDDEHLLANVTFSHLFKDPLKKSVNKSRNAQKKANIKARVADNWQDFKIHMNTKLV